MFIRLTIILFVSHILLSIGIKPSYQRTQQFQVKNLSRLINKSLLKHQQKYFHSKKILKIYISLFSGYKRNISKKLRVRLNNLGLMHLLTPSGLHLSSIFLFISPFFKRTRFKYLKTLFLLPILFLDDFHSLKRVTLFCILGMFKRLKTIEKFMIVFVIDYLIGGYNSSPLSYTFSFLFWGSILSIPRLDKIYYKVIPLILAKLLLSIHLNDDFYIFMQIAGIFLTFIFTIAFPYLIIGLAGSYLIGFNPSEFLIHNFLNICEFVEANFFWFKLNTNAKLYSFYLLIIVLVTNNLITSLKYHKHHLSEAR